MRYRAVVLVAFVLLFGWLGARRALAGAPQPAAAPPSGGRVVWVSVRPGDSLWSIGSRFAPAGVDLRAWIYRVERANRLHGAVVFPGERLALPAA